MSQIRIISTNVSPMPAATAVAVWNGLPLRAFCQIKRSPSTLSMSVMPASR